jgi:hypothetical protein
MPKLGTHRIKLIGKLSLNPMAWALLRGRQILKFGLLRKKDNKKKKSACVQPNGSRVFSALLFLYKSVVGKF